MRHLFGGTADYALNIIFNSTAVFMVGAPVTFWNASAGGTQYTDLTDLNGNAITGVTTTNLGAIPQFFGPQGVTQMYVSVANNSIRRAIVCVDGPSAAEVSAQKMPSLVPWYAALGNRQFVRCDIVCIGDSITEGQHAIGPPGTGFTNKWVAQLATMMRSRYPVPGLPSTPGRGYINVKGTGESVFTWPAALNGSPPAVNTGGKIAGVQLNTSGQSIVFTLNGDSADIMWQGVPFGGTFSYQVDSGAVTNIVTNFSPLTDGKITHISLGSAGAHTLTLAWVSGQSNIDGVVEYNGDFTSGIMTHDCGHFGWQASSWSSFGSGAASAWNAIAALSPNLVIISLGVNDQFTGTLPATYQANMQTIINNLKAQMTPPYPAFVLNMYPPRQNQNTYTYPWQQYVQAAYNIAAGDTSGAGGGSIVSVFDFTIGPRMPGADSDIYGFWQSGDAVHPSNLGHAAMADMLCTFLSSG